MIAFSRPNRFAVPVRRAGVPVLRGQAPGLRSARFGEERWRLELGNHPKALTENIAEALSEIGLNGNVRLDEASAQNAVGPVSVELPALNPQNAGKFKALALSLQEMANTHLTTTFEQPEQAKQAEPILNAASQLFQTAFPFIQFNQTSKWSARKNVLETQQQQVQSDLDGLQALSMLRSALPGVQIDASPLESELKTQLSNIASSLAENDSKLEAFQLEAQHRKLAFQKSFLGLAEATGDLPKQQELLTGILRETVTHSPVLRDLAKLHRVMEARERQSPTPGIPDMGSPSQELSRALETLVKLLETPPVSEWESLQQPFKFEE